MTSYEKNLIEKLNQLIEVKYIGSESITDSLCHDLGISRSNLYRILKEHFNTSPSLYIRKIKIEKAKELLKSTDMKIGEVAYHIGLDGPQNFTKYFTQQHGINPTDYRKSLSLKTEPAIQEEPEPIKNKPISVPLNKKKHQLSTQFTFLMPGLIVFILTAFGYYYWQKLYFSDDKTNPTSTITINKLDCFIPSNGNLNCDSLNIKFIQLLSQKEKINVIDLSDSASYRYYETNQKMGGLKYLLTGNVGQASNSNYLNIELLETNSKKIIWKEKIRLNKQNSELLFTEANGKISNVLNDKNKIQIKEKFYIIQDKTMAPYKQFIESSQQLVD